MARVPPMGNTVYGRMKKTGYLLGPEHRMAPDDFSPAAVGAAKGDDPSEQDKPPGFRDSATEGESCGDCQNFQGDRCQEYDYPTTANMVCDSFTEKGGNEDEEGEAGITAQDAQ